MPKRKIPEFKTEEEEAEFWETHSSVDYLDDTMRVEVDFSELQEVKRTEPLLGE